MSKETESQLLQRIAELEAEQKQIEDGKIPTIFGVRLDQVGEIHDPYSVNGGSPFNFKDHPPGLRLHWCNENRRNERGWKGFEPVFWEDDIGQNLDKYCYDPPQKLHNAVDAKVRRADSILCKIPIGVWVKRQLDREEKAHRAMASHRVTEREILEAYENGDITTVGAGLQNSERPIGGFKMRAETVSKRTEWARSAFAKDSPAGGNEAPEDKDEE